MNSEQRVFKYQIDHARKRLDSARNRQMLSLEEACRAEIKAFNHPTKDELILKGIESFLVGEISIVKARVRAFTAQQRTNMAAAQYYGRNNLSLSSALDLDKKSEAVIKIQSAKEARVKARFGKRIGLMHADANKVEDELVLGEASTAMKLVDAFIKKSF